MATGDIGRTGRIVRDSFEPAAVVELRIHGVSNTPPESMLDIDVEQLQQVAGDEDTMIFARKGEPTTERPIRVYSWGNLTHGRRDRALKDLQRALWMLLLPFAFANVAIWTRLHPPETSNAASNTAGRSAFWLRLFALGLTISLTLAVVGVALDQVVWQWIAADPPREACECTTRNAADIGWLEFLRGDGVGDTSRPLALGGAVVLVVMLTIWAVARKSFQYEAETDPLANTSGSTPWNLAPGENRRSPFESRWFWRGKEQVSHLSRSHLAAVFSVVTLVTVLPLVLPGDFAQSGEGRRWLGLAGVLALVTLIGAVLSLLLPAATHRTEKPWGAVMSLSTVALAGVTTTITLVSLAFGGVEIAPSGGLPWYAETVLVLSALQVGVLLLMWLWRTGAHPSAVAWKGRGPAVLASTGWFLAMLYGAATLYYAADYLNGSGSPVGRDDSIVLPMALQVAAACVPVVVGGLAVVAVVAIGRMSAYTKERYKELTGGLDGPPGPHRARRANDVAKAQGRHDFLERDAVNWLGVVVLAGFILTLGATTLTLRETFWGDGPRLTSGAWILGPAGIGGRLLFFMGLALAFVASRVYGGGIWRRVLGIVWDVGTFWPRACHPWAPPSYAERCVPQLATYVGNRTPASSPGFILAGHSQGSVLAVATLWQLPEGNRRRCALLSFGTQLRGFYGRAFPAFFDEEQLKLLADAAWLANDVDHAPATEPRWRSLWRATDPIGYPVLYPRSTSAGFLSKVDRGPVKDPDDLAPPTNEYIDPKIWGHSNYMDEEDYKTQARDLGVMLRRPAAAP